MSREEEESSAAEVVSTHAPTTIPEEPTPVSPASPGIPLDPEPAHPSQSASEHPTDQPTKPQAGRFIEIISTDGSRASAEDNADPPPKQAIAPANGISNGETEATNAMRTGRSPSNVWRRNSKKKNSGVQPSKLDAPTSSHGHLQQISPTTDSSTQRASPHPNDQSSPSSEGGRHFRAFKKIKGDRNDPDRPGRKEHGDHDDDHDHDDEQHRILAALYPLTNFIGYRPLSHPHTPADRRRTPSHPQFNRFHYLCGRILTFGLPVSGDTGEIARYRDPDTGRIELVTMYKDQVGAKAINSIHSVIAAWVVIAFICLLSRSKFYRDKNAPLIIGAFATEAVVTFFAFRTPLAQPKNILIGNTIAAVIGVAMEKAFAHTNYDLNGVYGVDWAAAATAVAVAVFAMQILGVTHPPGAAIALLSITSKSTNRLNWWLVPIVVISSLVVIGWALLINNLGGRRFPENWFYTNAFAEPPIIGPEKLPFSNSPWHPPSPRRRGPKRKRGPRDDHEAAGEPNEKGFYRVPDSGARVTHGFGPEPRGTAAATAGMASHNLGGAARVRAYSGSQLASGSRASFGANGMNGSNGEDGRTTRASEVTKVDSRDPAPAGSSSNPATQVAQGSSAVPKTETAAKSRMIETDATVMSRNNSKGSKRSRRSVVVHVNENRRHSTGSSSKAPPVPAIQWRGRDPL